MINGAQEMELRRLLAQFPTTTAGRRELFLALHSFVIEARVFVRVYLDLTGYALTCMECHAAGPCDVDLGPIGCVIEERLIRHLVSNVKVLQLAEIDALKAVQHLLYATRDTPGTDYVTFVHHVLDAVDHWREAAAIDASERRGCPEQAEEERSRVYRWAVGCLGEHLKKALHEESLRT